jgi:hypothetical protein
MQRLSAVRAIIFVYRRDGLCCHAGISSPGLAHEVLSRWLLYHAGAELVAAFRLSRQPSRPSAAKPLTKKKAEEIGVVAVIDPSVYIQIVEVQQIEYIGP